MPKLLKYQRQALERKLLSLYEEPRKARIAELEAALGERVLAAYFRSAADRAAFAQLPDGWVMFATGISWNRRRKGRGYVSLASTTRVPRELAQGEAEIDDEGVERAYDEIQAVRKELSEGSDRLYKKIRAVLYNITTVAALQAHWPEAAALLESTAVVTNLPTVPIAELNKAIGLKPAEKKRRRA